MLLQPGAQGEAGGCQPPSLCCPHPGSTAVLCSPPPPPTPSKTLSHFPSGKSGSQTPLLLLRGCFSPWISLPPGCCSCFQAAPPARRGSVVAHLSPPASSTPARKVIWGVGGVGRGSRVLWGGGMGKAGCRDGVQGEKQEVFGGAPQFGSTEQHSPHPHGAGGLDNPGLDVALGKFLPSPRSSRAPKPHPSQAQHPSQRDKSQCRGWEQRQHKETQENLAVIPPHSPPAWKRSRICPTGTSQHQLKQHCHEFVTRHSNLLPS